MPILQCHQLSRSLPFYATLGFQAEELPGYAVLRNGPTELHLFPTIHASPGGCLLRITDAPELRKRLRGQDMLGPLDDTVPGMMSFQLTDPDGNHLIFVSSG
ncbi:hypothetical protein AAH979_42285 [Plantactinospora sp. ZYX-F-223]|uniref:hypothetical protein n=1 Tax=Plantactinospora sp. ZYX-F-223 TaxID=3144103 RepID=UPI0031FC962C